MNALITSELLSTAFDYQSYRKLIDQLLTAGKTTGPNNSESMLGYTRLNAKRMDKWEKIGKILPELYQILSQVEQGLTWLVLTEGWCGDAAQSLPFIHKMVQINDLINLKLVLRDQNPQLMEAYLTDGGRSIPKLIVLNQHLQELGTWGPRPRPMQDLMLENKTTQAKTYEKLAEEMHFWYARDRGFTMQQEFIKLLPQWLKKDQLWSSAKKKA